MPKFKLSRATIEALAPPVAAAPAKPALPVRKAPRLPKDRRIIISLESQSQLVPKGTTGRVVEAFGSYVGVRLDGETEPQVFWRCEVKPIPDDAPIVPVVKLRFKRKGKAAREEARA